MFYIQKQQQQKEIGMRGTKQAQDPFLICLYVDILELNIP